jgi:hypothetical protein
MNAERIRSKGEPGAIGGIQAMALYKIGGAL